jgi:predicted DCC family thiol-disulfide oxidoreductase YuxK
MEPHVTATVYYDGACPVCSREIAQYRRARGAENLDFVDVTRCDASQLGPDLTRDAALARMHVRDAEGRMVSGAAAFAALWRSLPGWAWLGRVASWPVVLPVLEVGYRGFLRVRTVWRRLPRTGQDRK